MILYKTSHVEEFKDKTIICKDYWNFNIWYWDQVAICRQMIALGTWIVVKYTANLLIWILVNSLQWWTWRGTYVSTQVQSHVKLQHKHDDCCIQVIWENRCTVGTKTPMGMSSSPYYLIQQFGSFFMDKSGYVCVILTKVKTTPTIHTWCH